MSDIFQFDAVARVGVGTSASKAVRREGGIPAIIYGAGKEPQQLTLSHNEVLKHLEHEAVYSHILDVVVDGKKEKAVLKGLQRHPSKPRVLHMDFQRVSAKEKLRIHVPLHFVNAEDAVGVKKGAVVTHSQVDVEVTCLPKNLPEFIEIDLLALDVGESIHLSEIQLPKGVEIIALAQGSDHDLPVVSVTAVRGGAAEDEDEDGDSDSEESE
ncbi:MAG TPA: 50S ribosomal protein L25/general stress protein Ctc [Methylococcaceae bacterium]|nr:50S ribosomal protein L25/general stress protein Ctc [Methylococcaceae bacterium]HIL39051.1 50S ribosomal protein L25/general stress protein Ctc [Methylococcales bacterium]